MLRIYCINDVLHCIYKVVIHSNDIIIHSNDIVIHSNDITFFCACPKQGSVGKQYVTKINLQHNKVWLHRQMHKWA